MVHTIGNTKQVFVDWDLIEAGNGLARYYDTKNQSKVHPTTHEMPYGIQIQVHYPRIDNEPIMVPNKKSDGAFICYVSIFEDDGIYRMYTMNWGDVRLGWDNPYQYFLTYAESTDGINWHKPKIGEISCNGSTNNSLVYAGHASPAFKDPNGKPGERYKLVCVDRSNGKTNLFGAVSSDGRRFKPIQKPLLTNYHSDTHNVITFDKERDIYIGYFRGKMHGRRTLRTIAYAETSNFNDWPVPEVIVTPDVKDPPDMDIYTNSYTRWPDTNTHLMFPAFYQRRLDETEIHIMTSRNGKLWERPLNKPIIPNNIPNSEFSGSVYAGCNLIRVRPGEWSLPISPRPSSHNSYQYPGGMTSELNRGSVYLASWREDGITSLEAETEGECTTIPIIFTGSRLEVNGWTRFGGSIAFELVDASNENNYTNANAIPGFSFADNDFFSGDSLNHQVSWNGNPDVSFCAGKPIRIRLKMRRSRLHAFRFREAKH